jgi:hypothetical protein
MAHGWPQTQIGLDVRFGSKADLTAPKSDFRFTPESGLKSDIAPFPLCAISDRQQNITAWCLSAKRKTASRRSLQNPIRVLIRRPQRQNLGDASSWLLKINAAAKKRLVT